MVKTISYQIISRRAKIVRYYSKAINPTGKKGKGTAEITELKIISKNNFEFEDKVGLSWKKRISQTRHVFVWNCGM